MARLCVINFNVHIYDNYKIIITRMLIRTRGRAMTERRMHTSKTIKDGKSMMGKRLKRVPYKAKTCAIHTILLRNLHLLRSGCAEPSPNRNRRRRYRYVKLACTNLNSLVRESVHRAFDRRILRASFDL